MGIAILVFFLAIFGGILFLLGFIWFFFIRKKNARRQNRSFSSGGSMNQDSDFSGNDFADETSSIYRDNSTYTDSRPENINSESATSAKAGAEYITPSENYQHSNHSDAAASAESNYTESSFSTSDSSSSYDSGSSDSGSSSSSD